MNPAGAHRSQPLRRRLFRYFATAIVLSVAFGAGLGQVIVLLTGHEHHAHPINQFVAARLAEAWQRPEARAALIDEAGTTLYRGVVLRDADGKVIERHGESCDPVFAKTTIRSAAGQTLGELAVCPPRGFQPPGAGPGHGPPRPVARILVPLLIALVAIWAASGRVARLLAKPLQELAQVADALGHGQLSRRAELPIRHHGVDELDTLAQSINNMATRIERQLHDQRELLAAVSHELRTPLGHAKLLIEMARDQPDGQKPLDELEIELAELERMVGQLLASARLDFTALAQHDLNGAQLAVRVLERAGVDASKLQVDTEQTTVRGDAALLAQALANLLDNANRHGGNLVMLRLRAADDMLFFEALDDGPGFAPGQAESAFEPFQRGAANHGGLGLGLTLVRRIAIAHRGNVTAGNRPEGGACVSLGVPLASA